MTSSEVDYKSVLCKSELNPHCNLKELSRVGMEPTCFAPNLNQAKLPPADEDRGLSPFMVFYSIWMHVLYYILLHIVWMIHKDNKVKWPGLSDLQCFLGAEILD